jgi:hypothetical protein
VGLEEGGAVFCEELDSGAVDDAVRAWAPGEGELSDEEEGCEFAH